jgi:hypothetical protein
LQSKKTHKNHPETADKLPVLTPDGKKQNRDEVEKETPDAEQQEISPKQPLYEDKTEAYHIKNHPQKS